MRKNWQVKSQNLTLRKELSRQLHLSPAIAQLLINRNINGVDAARSFLRCQLQDLHDPFLLKGMEGAVGRINRAIENREDILIHGDYDVDGLTATALLEILLRRLGAKVTHYIPNRLEEGYGLSPNVVEFAGKKGVRLLITVDCGVNAHDVVDELNMLGVDTIITDHHEPVNEPLPDAFAVIDPLQDRCKYPYKHLSGAGVAFKLAQALCMDKGVRAEEHLDLVALGTVADVAPLTGENRILTKHGLIRLAKTEKPGLKALIDVTGLAGKAISAKFAGFLLSPRLNAAGRLGSAEDSLKLLLTNSPHEAKRLALSLDQNNRERQGLEMQTLKEAISKVESEINFKHHRVIVLHHEGWHAGVIGIVASRIVERYYRPAILIAMKDNFGKGSGRSIQNFHLFEALAECKGHLEEFGGHEYAAGIKIARAKIAGFRDSINAVAATRLQPKDLVPAIDIDMELSFDELTEELTLELERFAPFGVENPRPVFASRNLKLRGEPKLMRGNNMKFWVTDRKRTCEAVAFNMADRIDLSHSPESIDLAYSPEINDWQGTRTIQLNLKDLRTRVSGESRGSRVSGILKNP